MKRFWIQLSVANAGLILGIIILMLLISALLVTFSSSTDGPAPEGSENGSVQQDGDENNAIPSDLLIGLTLTVIFSGLVGIISGIVVSRRVSAPITRLAAAAQFIGAGDLNYRVNIRGTQEIADLGQAFNQMASDLQHAEVLRRNLMADVSHELRTPLTVLQGQLRAALDHIYTLNEAEIAHLYEQTNHLIRLVNDLRELAQAEANQLPLRKTPTNVAQLLEEVLQTFEPLAEEKHITLKSEIAAPLPVVNLDAGRIRQVLHNIVGNAFQHTPSDGMITLNAAAQNHELRITVQDNGIGIAPQHIAHVFDRFFRVDSSRNRHTGSTGLGLAIARAIVETHDGQIMARSGGINQGTAFTISLPTQ